MIRPVAVIAIEPRRVGTAGSILIAIGGLASGALPVSYRGFPAGVAIVYFGLIALIVAWWRLPHTDIRTLMRTTALWAAPLALAPPLFSRDVYSYLAQGAMVVAGPDVYRAGPAQLGGPLAAEVAPIWQETPAPYGPVFLQAAAAVAGSPAVMSSPASSACASWHWPASYSWRRACPGWLAAAGWIPPRRSGWAC